MSLSLQLLPEFGWSLRGQPVFGPGSVFQGYIELKLDETLTLDRIRLVFHGQESLLSPHTMADSCSDDHNTLFAVQQTLWESKDGLKSLDADTYKFPFTLQMPMVQYPPSMNHPVYNCSFRLTAVVESLQSQQEQVQPAYKTLLLKNQEMLYMPFVETQLLKQPLVQTEEASEMILTTRLHSLGYVPGDAILGSLTVDCKPGSTSSPKKTLDMSLKLYQITTNLLHPDVPVCVDLVASSIIKLSPVYVSSSVVYSTALELDVPDNLVPTFTYSSLASVTYQLVLTVKRKGPLSMWAQEISKEWPLTIGTLGAGVRSSSDLSLYTTLNNEDDASLRPKFMKAVEYEDTLPVYQPDRLPEYPPSTPMNMMAVL